MDVLAASLTEIPGDAAVAQVGLAGWLLLGALDPFVKAPPPAALPPAEPKACDKNRRCKAQAPPPEPLAGG